MSTPHDRRTALERRIWRLAHLLTGDAAAASTLVDRVLDAQRDPGALEPARLDRLVIQQARELAGAAAARAPAPLPPGQNDLAHRTLASALSMSRQPLEAWVLARLDELDELHCARAMDCSKTALRHHLTAADDQMRSRLGEQAPAALAALKKYADALDPGPILAAHRARRGKERKRRFLIVGGVIAIVVLSALLLGLRAMIRT